MARLIAKEPLITRIGYPLVRYILLGPITHFLWIKDIIGLENVPSKGPCLLASNHESYFDFILILSALKRKAHFLAAEKFYENKMWKLFLNCGGSIRVDRHARMNVVTYKEIIKAIHRERIVGMFPEGTRSPDGALMKGKIGIAHLAIKTGLPVIPVGVIGSHEILRKGQKVPNLTKATIKFGKPMSFSHLKLDKNADIDLQEITDEIMLKIAELTGEEYPHKHQIKSSFKPFPVENS